MFVLVFSDVKLQDELELATLRTSQDKVFKQTFNTRYKKSPTAVVSS